MPWQINQFILWKCHALADKSIHSVEILDDLSLPIQNMDELLTSEKKIENVAQQSTLVSVSMIKCFNCY